MTTRLSQNLVPREINLPLNQPISVRFREWKYYRPGIIVRDPTYRSYLFHDLSGKPKSAIRQISTADPPSILLADGLFWRAYQ